jgi:hypothetical protein
MRVKQGEQSFPFRISRPCLGFLSGPGMSVLLLYLFLGFPEALQEILTSGIVL